ncbi:MAG: tRNA pseudouridine(13) synthase TruD [Thaumarchaeota archaeon]|nr:MAG: tRNA pseudouridine(13) synthase TruD [Nitrososphaerota archaeon]
MCLSNHEIMNKDVPHIDKMAGIELYSTKYDGIGGSIKVKNEDFKVQELLVESILNGMSKIPDKHYSFPVYLLQKKGLDSNHATMEIFNRLGIRLRVLGIKDSKAVTTQYATSEEKKNREGNTAHTNLTFLGFSKHSIRKSHIMGNQFEVKISNPVKNEISGFIPEIKNIPNFYGLQRFGSERLVTHLVGREIIKRDFKKAVEIFLSHTTEYDTQFSKEIREKCNDPRNYGHVMKIIPRGMDLERNILQSLIAGKGYISVLRSIPISIRRLFVHAFQAFMFNKCLSSMIKDEEPIAYCIKNDFCFRLENQLALGKLIKYQDDSFTDLVPAMHLPGYSLKSNDGRFERRLSLLIKEENISPKDFYIKEMQELSVEGGFRQLPLLVNDFSYHNNLLVKFKIPSGSYATILLRELMKPVDPIEAGF